MRSNATPRQPVPDMRPGHTPVLRIGLDYWISTLGLAAASGQSHTAIISRINRLPVSLEYRLEHFRWSPDRRGMWISATGFAQLGLAGERYSDADYRPGLFSFIHRWLREGWRGACQA